MSEEKRGESRTGGAQAGDATQDAPRSGARGDTIDQPTVVPEARHGVDYASPSGGASSGTGAPQARQVIEEEEGTE